MPSSGLFEHLRLMTFGESHGPAVGVVLDGIQPGIEVDLEAIQRELDARRPGTHDLSSPRREPDELQVLSGVFEGKTTGAPICFAIFAKDARSQDYAELARVFRPGHADLAVFRKYGIRDWRGGGRASGRETAARVAAGALARQILESEGIRISGFVRAIAGVECSVFDPDDSRSHPLRCPDSSAAARMDLAIREAAACGDTVGGVVEVHLRGVGAGLGDPVLHGLDAMLAHAMMSIPGVKGVEVGDGFELPRMRGSASNDPITPAGFDSNHLGGITGGITTGQPIVVRLAVRAPSSIRVPQRTIDIDGRAAELALQGRFDPCIAPRVVPVAEAMAALVVLDAHLRQKAIRGDEVSVNDLRALIDGIDHSIVESIARRVEIAQAIGERKKAERKEIQVPEREREVAAHWKTMAAELRLDPARVAAVAESVVTLCREAQQQPSDRPVAVRLSNEAAELVPSGDGLVVRREGQEDSPVVGACLSLTSRCNEQCIMCMEERDPNECFDLPLQQAILLAAPFTGRIPVINSSASEALLYEHFLDYARYVRDHGSSVGVVTNGLALARRDYLDRCVEAGLRQVMLSCHTSRAETFGLLTGVPKGFPAFLHALQNLDDHNRNAPLSRAVRIIVEVVVMRPLLDEVDELFSLLDKRLAASRPVIRIESMRMVNRAKAHPELQPSIDELGGVMERIMGRYAATHELTVRFIPLCLIAGHEHLASEVPQVLRREKTLGNAHCHSAELVEVMRPESALAQPDWEPVCGKCSLASVCPGVYDIPVPPGSLFPRARATPLQEVAARLVPPIGAHELAQALASLERSSLRATGPRLSPQDVKHLAPLLLKLRTGGADVKTTAERIEIEFADDRQPTGRTRLILTALGADMPHFKRVGAVQLTYVGEQTPRLLGLVRLVSKHLAQ